MGNIPNREVIEKFTFLILKPYYSHERKLKKYKNDLLESEYYPNLKSIACFFGTQQEGYLQCFEYNNKDDDVSHEFSISNSAFGEKSNPFKLKFIYRIQ